MEELSLVRKAGVRGDLRQGELAAFLQKLLHPLDADRDYILVRRRPAGLPELPVDVVGADLDVLSAASLLGLCQADQALRDDLSRLLDELMNDLTGRLDLADQAHTLARQQIH